VGFDPHRPYHNLTRRHSLISKRRGGVLHLGGSIQRFESTADRIDSFRTRVLLTPYPWGPSRMDAIALIVARVTSVAPDIPQNWSAALAPTDAI
jgi:hypothetical protein